MDDSTTTTNKRRKVDLVQVLNDMYANTLADENSRKSGRVQIRDNAASILKQTVKREEPELLGKLPCLISLQSVDGRGRAQRSMRASLFTGTEKTNFRPWHITWINANGLAPEGGCLQYSHLCNQENCVEPSHGVWEDDKSNKDRWSCRVCSHVILPDQKILRICPHTPCCINPLKVTSWNDERFLV